VEEGLTRIIVLALGALATDFLDHTSCLAM
jgi:hypothetical protein